jgi:hypothetical protein
MHPSATAAASVLSGALFDFGCGYLANRDGSAARGGYAVVPFSAGTNDLA